MGIPTSASRKITTWGDGRPEYIVEKVNDSRGQVFGFKATWDQAEALCRTLEAQGEPVPGMDLRNVFPGLRIVHLLRRDKVRQAISLWRAATSGMWHIPDNAGTQAGRPDYDFEALLWHFAGVMCDDWMWIHHFARTRGDVLTVVYEDYVAQALPTTIERICKHIAHGPRLLAASGSTDRGSSATSGPTRSPSASSRTSVLRGRWERSRMPPVLTGNMLIYGATSAASPKWVGALSTRVTSQPGTGSCRLCYGSHAPMS